MLIREFIELTRLALKRKKSPADYFRFQEAQARHVVSKIKSIFDLPAECRVLDFGCGNGGYTSVMAAEFQDVFGVDCYIAPLFSRLVSFPNVSHQVDDLLTFRTEPRDLVFCASVIEHISPDQRGSFFASIRRNLKPGGYLYLSFPPFYGIIGGHACTPFHYFPDNMAFFLTSKIKKYQISSYETMNGCWGLHKTRIATVKAALIENGFKIVEIRSRYLPDAVSRLIKENDYLNWHVEFYCFKT